MDNTKRNVFRILHGFLNLNEVVDKWTEDKKNHKVLFAYYNLDSSGSSMDINSIAGVIDEMWTDSEGLVVSIQTSGTPAGRKLEVMLEYPDTLWKVGAIGNVRDDGTGKNLDSLSGIYFLDK